MVVDVLIENLIFGDHQLPTALPIPYHSAFPNTPFSTIPPPPVGVKGDTLIPRAVSYSRIFLKAQAQPPFRGLVSIARVFWFRRWSVSLFWELLTIDPIAYLPLCRWCLYGKLDVLMTLRNDLWAFAVHLWVLMKNIQSLYWPFKTNKHKYLATVCDGEAVSKLAYFLSDVAKKVCKAFTAKKMGTDTHVNHKT